MNMQSRRKTILAGLLSLAALPAMAHPALAASGRGGGGGGGGGGGSGGPSYRVIAGLFGPGEIGGAQYIVNGGTDELKLAFAGTGLPAGTALTVLVAVASGSAPVSVGTLVTTAQGGSIDVKGAVGSPIPLLGIGSTIALQRADGTNALTGTFVNSN